MDAPASRAQLCRGNLVLALTGVLTTLKMNRSLIGTLGAQAMNNYSTGGQQNRTCVWPTHRWFCASLAILTLSACGEPAATSQESAAGAGPQLVGAATAQAAPAALPVSLNTVMVALINHAADPIWVAAWRSPESDADWRQLERMAVQLEVGGALLKMPGVGPNDLEWATNPSWQAWASALQQAGAQAASAVRNRDTQAIAGAGDRIVETCEGCHIEFKPDLPTGGQFGELSPNAADFEDGEAP